MTANSTPKEVSGLDQFTWEPQPLGQAIINELLDGFFSRCPDAFNLRASMTAVSGTRFLDWVDCIETPHTPDLESRLVEAGFTRKELPGAARVFVHDGAMFPAVVLSDMPTTSVGIKVDSVADCLATWKLDHPITGSPLSPFRKAAAFAGDGAELCVIERHGYRGFAPVRTSAEQSIKAVEHLESLRRRRRDFGVGAQADERGFAEATRLVDAAIKDLGQHWACDLFFQAERDYWQRRNRAARVQKARQDALGLGWANHDHHTYRGSRRNHARLVAFLERLGFRCRERFYAGAEAGWGAQVIEQPVAGITIFADVDMSPEEVVGDFSHAGLPDRAALGTIGLWCELHGEAFLQAGMHHLECQFDWHALKEQLERDAGIRMMDPFTTFPFLRQAFTEGERWSVMPERIDALETSGRITPAQAAQFRAHGAIGSHLENLERNDGYKGFNQTGVSQIIAKTDPRRLVSIAGD